jgi:hypothetical protein
MPRQVVPVDYSMVGFHGSFGRWKKKYWLTIFKLTVQI